MMGSDVGADLVRAAGLRGGLFCGADGWPEGGAAEAGAERKRVSVRISVRYGVRVWRAGELVLLIDG